MHSYVGLLAYSLLKIIYDTCMQLLGLSHPYFVVLSLASWTWSAGKRAQSKKGPVLAVH